MANEEHLAILRQGVEVWNQWRKEYLDVMPNLQQASLQGVDLVGANLQRANLSWAHLQQANLQRANLSWAELFWVDFREAYLLGTNFQRADFRHSDLAGANLEGANLRRVNLVGVSLSSTNLQQANLQRANFTGASLEGADLWQAILRGANLLGTRVQGANMREAEIGWTRFIDIDLRGFQNLDTVGHIGPSTIGIDTLYKSRGDIPEVFLRGCGVPDSMIEYARSLVAAERPIDYYSCFISYSSHDEALAARLYADLQARGVRCWYAPHDMQIGEPILSGIDRGIRLHDKLLLILSESSVESGWVEQEVHMALAREKTERRRVLFPIRIDDSVIESRQGWPAILRDTINIGDFRQWKQHDAYQSAFARLLRDLKAE